ncbi:MAG TPA: hypothetical protein VFI95_12500 [Terriglobales bacterium]|nr:hypothetical protein [Terriglobales bacterium]
MKARIVTSFLLAAVPVVLCVFRLPASSPEPGSPVVYTLAKKYELLAWIHGSERFPAGAQVYISRKSGAEPLTKGLVASADPAVFFDGTRILLSGRQQAQDPWNIWEIVLEDGTLRRVTSCAEDCVRPLYLPDARFVYAHKTGGRFVIEARSLSGSDALPLTYGPGNFLPYDVLHDGRILFGAAYPLNSGTTPELYSVYSDGSGVESYRCDHGHARFRGQQLLSGDVVFADSQGLAGFTSALANEVKLEAPRGEYAGDVVEFPDESLLVTYRPNPAEHFKLVSWKLGSSVFSSYLAVKGMDVVQASLLAPRTVPNRHPSGLHDWTYANVLCLNAYTSKHHFADRSISSVRLYTQDSSGREKLLGTSEVESDGSFYLRVPADQPLKVELRDPRGSVLKNEEGWFWMRRGEQRVCVGCHAGPETAPENAIPEVLKKSIIAVDMTVASTRETRGGH